MKKWKGMVTFLTLAGLLLGTLPAFAQNEILVGNITPLSGPLSFGGTEVKNGIAFAVEKKGTLFGKPIKVVMGDSPDPTAGVAELERLVTQHKIKIFFGGYGSALEGAIQKAAERHKVLYMGTVNWADYLTEGGLKYYFRWTPPVSKYAKGFAADVLQLGKEYLKKSPKELRVGLIHSDATAPFADPIQKFLKELGYELTLKEMYPSEIKDFTSLIMKMKAANLDMVCPSQYTADGLLFRRQMKALKYEPLVYAPGIIYDQPEFGQLKDAADGVVVLSYTNPEMNPKAAPGLAEFREKYLKRIGHAPLTHALQAYAGASVFLEQLEKAGSADVEKMIEALLQIDLPPGRTPAYWGCKFDPKTHQNLRAGEPFVMAQWQDGGKYKVVGPGEFGVAKLKIPYTK
jgi:branched-chain amino acid transport system substrate-binding protein